MTAKVDDPQKKSEQLALDFRKAWKKDMLSKKRATIAEVRAENDRVEKSSTSGGSTGPKMRQTPPNLRPSSSQLRRRRSSTWANLDSRPSRSPSLSPSWWLRSTTPY
jgi:hypothetical protein